MVIIELNSGNFTQETNSGLILVDYWAEWCMPCKMMTPILDQIADEYPQLKVAKFNTDVNSQMMQSLGISAIPTIVLYKDGQLIKKWVGIQTKKDMEAVISKYIIKLVDGA